MERARAGLVLLIVVLCLLPGCAYYNIFWMARDEYDRALSVLEHGGFWDPYAHENARGEAARLIDSCIQRCGKLLVLYPDSRWADDALYLMGNCFVLKGSNEDAIRKYDEILTLYPSSEFAERARYMKAYTLAMTGSSALAAQVLESLAEETKDDRLREQALFCLGRIYQEQEDCERGVPHFERYLAAYRDGRGVGRSRLALGNCLLELDRVEEALEVLRPLAEEEGPLTGISRLLMGRGFARLGLRSEAIEEFRRAEASAQVDSTQARARIEVAAVMEERGMPWQAIDELAAADSLVDPKKLALKGEIAYRTGFIYEKSLEDYDSATVWYDKVSPAAPGVGDIAARRSRALKEVAKYREMLADSVPETDEQRAETLFLMAETQLDDLGMLEEAVDLFVTVIDSFPEIEFAARAMLAMATLLAAEGDTLTDSYYRRVIERFPNTVFENVARERLGLPRVDIVIELPDTAAADSAAADSAAADTLTVPGPVGPPVEPQMDDTSEVAQPDRRDE
jgi:tetratricopeptide (TPR) repeat protein